LNLERKQISLTTKFIPSFFSGMIFNIFFKKKFNETAACSVLDFVMTFEIVISHKAKLFES
jgi:hypothetical protein